MDKKGSIPYGTAPNDRLALVPRKMTAANRGAEKGSSMGSVAKQWWFRPALLAVIIFAVLLLLAKGRTIAPFVYNLF